LQLDQLLFHSRHALLVTALDKVYALRKVSLAL
jgi:hypothetical protein